VLLLLVVVKDSNMGFCVSELIVYEYERAAPRVLPSASCSESAGIAMVMVSPAVNFFDPVSDMVITCREIEVVTVSVVAALLDVRRGFEVPPGLYEIISSKYNVTVESVIIPEAPLAGTMEPE
jgi:hypothetical protein